VEVWERAVKSGRYLRTVDEMPVRVLYPGRPSDQPGADFQDAVVDIDGRVAKGNVEVHVRSGDWRAHGHHRNAAYNGVVLHVVMWHDGEPLTALENGVGIPVVALGGKVGYDGGRQDRAPPLPCRGAAEDRITAAVDRAGDDRFREKAETFAGELCVMGPGQCIYRGIMTALGYTRNQSPFCSVAERLPLARLESIAGSQTGATALANLEALLLGTAGFLPSQRPGFTADSHPWIDTIEKQWRASGPAPGLAHHDWSLFRVRPGNHPARRLAGMARLLWRCRESGLLATLLAGLETANGWSGLIDVLTVAADGYWADHCDFGAACRGLDGFLVGKSRAGDIAVNVILPFAAAGSGTADQPGLAATNMALYETCPPAAENAIERHMRAQLGLKRSVINTARRQQGLLHLYKRFCTQGRCGECALAN